MHSPGILASADGLVDELIEVVIMGENDVTTHIEQEALRGDIRAGQAASLREGINHQPILMSFLRKTRRSTKTRRSRANNQNINRGGSGSRSRRHGTIQKRSRQTKQSEMNCV